MFHLVMFLWACGIESLAVAVLRLIVPLTLAALGSEDPGRVRDDAAAPTSHELGPRGWSTFVEADGIRYCRYGWPAPGKASGVVLLLHGHGSFLPWEFLRRGDAPHRRRYSNSWVEALNDMQLDVVGFDLAGRGRSGSRSGLRGDADVRTHVRHALALAAELREQHGPELPIFLVGVSLGGHIALRCLHAAPAGLLAGAVLLAPMLELSIASHMGANTLLKAVAPVLAKHFPTAPLVSTPVSTNSVAQQEHDAEPLCLGRWARCREGWDYVTACEEVFPPKHGKRGIADVEAPLLVMHCLNDAQIGVEGSMRLADRAPRCQMLAFGDDFHDLVHEWPCSELAKDAMLCWLDAQLAQLAAQ